MSQSVKKFKEIPNPSPESFFFNEPNFFLQKKLSLWNFYSRKCPKKARTNLSLASLYLRYQHDTCKDLISTWQMAIQCTLLFTGPTPPHHLNTWAAFLISFPSWVSVYNSNVFIYWGLKSVRGASFTFMISQRILDLNEKR